MPTSLKRSQLRLSQLLVALRPPGSSQWLCAVFAAWLLLCAPLLVSVQAHAEDNSAAATLGRALGTLEQLSGTFSQSVREADASDAQESFSAGRFGVLRPDRFFWDIEQPDSQLVLAADGQLWHYDRDLATVTQRPLQASSALPLQILSTDYASLSRDFEVSELQADVFELKPRQPQADFEQLQLTLAAGLPVRMQLVDKLGRVLDIRFDALRTRGLTAEDFEFSPPPGVDVFRSAAEPRP
jgi:outer membrane lipoprotein carrier protein